MIRLDGVNQRRYGPAWIALVTGWPIGKSPELRFGGQINHNVAEIDAPAGAIVKFGRTDHRGRETQNGFGYVLPNGEIQPLGKVKARELWLADHSKKEDDAA